jgi:hypothetical protein
MPRKPLDNEREYGSLATGGTICQGQWLRAWFFSMLTVARCQAERGINARYTSLFRRFLLYAFVKVHF